MILLQRSFEEQMQIPSFNWTQTESRFKSLSASATFESLLGPIVLKSKNTSDQSRLDAWTTMEDFSSLTLCLFFFENDSTISSFFVHNNYKNIAVDLLLNFYLKDSLTIKNQKGSFIKKLIEQALNKNYKITVISEITKQEYNFNDTNNSVDFLDYKFKITK